MQKSFLPSRATWLSAVLAAAVACIGIAPAVIQAQDMRIGDPEARYARVMSLLGLVPSRSLTILPDPGLDVGVLLAQPGHPWSSPGQSQAVATPQALGGARQRVFINSNVPRGANDGAVWQGRGVTAATDVTASFRWRGISIRLNPTVIFTQNASFDLAAVAPPEQPRWAYPWRTLDWPQRFGDDGYWTFDPGDSRLAVDWGPTRFSFGNESLWWGPAIRNAIVMGNNAPGFQHASVMTSRPLDVGVGTLEGRWFWGGLSSSPYFDPSAPDDRYFTGIALAWSPRWLDGLTLGGTRVFQEYVPSGGLPLREYFLVFQGLVKAGQVSEDQPDGNDARDQLLSVFARWVFPASGAEVFLEWARTDHALDFEDFLQEPEHSQGYTLGLQKVTSRTPDRLLVLSMELTHLEASPTFQLRPRATYYTHRVVTQGYTHKGQILGAWVGPGGNSQYLGLELFDPWGAAAVFVQRQVHDNDAFWVWAEANDRTFDSHHVSFDLGVNALVFAGDFDLAGGFVVTRQINRWFSGPHLWNVNLRLSVGWRPQ